MNCGAVCGSYIANATFTNNSPGDATVVAAFKSGAHETFVVPAGGQKEVSKEIDHGEWKAHDPLLSLEVTTANGAKQVFNDPSQGGVQLRRYSIGADHKITRDD